MAFETEFDRNFSSGLRREAGPVPEEGGSADAGFNLDGDFEAPNLRLTDRADPIDTTEMCTYSPENKFVAGLGASVGVGPGAIILWPLSKPVIEAGTKLDIFSELFYGAKLTVFPDDITPGWVPCVGQTYLYADGSRFRVPIIAAAVPGSSVGGVVWNGLGSAAAYLMKIPPNPLNSPVRRNFLARIAPRPQEIGGGLGS